jgi:hypothetical protein
MAVSVSARMRMITKFLLMIAQVPVRRQSRREPLSRKAAAAAYMLLKTLPRSCMQSRASGVRATPVSSPEPEEDHEQDQGLLHQLE